MLLSPEVLRGIVEGRVQLAFRCWERPRVRVGTRLRTLVGLVEVVAVDEVNIAEITEADAALAGLASLAELVQEISVWSSKGPVHRVQLLFAGPDPRIELSYDDRLSPEDIAALWARLQRMDRSAAEP